jgi:lipopolysaccharide export system protein LptA
MEPWLQTKRPDRGANARLAGAVLAVLLLATIAIGTPPPSEGEASRISQRPVRIQAEQLVAEKETATAEFSGAVRVEGDGYTITADYLTIHFRPGTVGGNSLAGTISAKEISRVIARGQVRIGTDALTASAEQAVYEPDSGQISLLAPEASAPAKRPQRGQGGAQATHRPSGSRVRVTLAPTAAR